MANEFANWLMEILSSFDGSDFFAFIFGCLSMIVWKNVQAATWNRSRQSGGDKSIMGTDDVNSTAGEQKRGRKINLPKMNMKYFVWLVMALGILGVMWSTVETGNAIRQNVADTKQLAVAVCENAKVSGVERKALQDLLISSMNAPESKLPVDDPARKEWGRKLGLQYLGTLDDAALQRKNIQEGKGLDPDFWERYFGPEYPEPDCLRPYRN